MTTHTPTPCVCERLRKLIASKSGEDATDYLFRAVNERQGLIDLISEALRIYDDVNSNHTKAREIWKQRAINIMRSIAKAEATI